MLERIVVIVVGEKGRRSDEHTSGAETVFGNDNDTPKTLAWPDDLRDIEPRTLINIILRFISGPNTLQTIYYHCPLVVARVLRTTCELAATAGPTSQSDRELEPASQQKRYVSAECSM